MANGKVTPVDEHDDSDLCSGCGGTGEMGAYCSRDLCSRCDGTGVDPAEMGDDEALPDGALKEG